MIADSLRAVGAGRSIVIDERGVILAGNGVRQAAHEAGITKVRVVDVAGDELVAVRRRGLSEEQKRTLALADNRAGELSTWNVEQLRADQEAGLAFTPWFDDREIRALLSTASERAGQTDPDLVVPPRRTPIKVGDLFELGRHRVICGDSTNGDDVARVLAGAEPPLMVTDPPYGVDYDPAWRARAGLNRNKQKLGRVANDDRADWTPAWRLFPGTIAYVWHGGMHTDVVKASLELAGDGSRKPFTLRAQIIWVKDRLVLSRGDYHWQHEPCWYAVRETHTGGRTPDRSQTTIWRIETPAPHREPAAESSTVWEIPARDDRGHGHGTQKPVECMARPMRNHFADEVYDPFVGSGTSVIAAERLGRTCYAIDLKPTYVQMVIDRWEAFTGLKARKVRAAA